MGWLVSTWPPEAGVISPLQEVNARLQVHIHVPFVLFVTMQILHYNALTVIKNKKNYLMALLKDERFEPSVKWLGRKLAPPSPRPWLEKGGVPTAGLERGSATRSLSIEVLLTREERRERETHTTAASAVMWMLH